MRAHNPRTHSHHLRAACVLACSQAPPSRASVIRFRCAPTHIDPARTVRRAQPFVPCSAGYASRTNGRAHGTTATRAHAARSPHHVSAPPRASAHVVLCRQRLCGEHFVRCVYGVMSVVTCVCSEHVPNQESVESHCMLHVPRRCKITDAIGIEMDGPASRH
jgi:hypothetical protein